MTTAAAAAAAAAAGICYSSIFKTALSFSSICYFRSRSTRTLEIPATLVRTLSSTPGRHRIKNHKRINNYAIAAGTDGSISSSLNETSLCEEVSTVGTSCPPASSSVISYPEYHRLLPCPQTNLPPRVEHMVVTEDGSVSKFICKALGLPPLYVDDLIRFGSVYYALVCPKPPPTATPEQMKLYLQYTTPQLLKKRSSIKGKTTREAQKTLRITHPDEFVEVGTYLRVHVHPKRFPRCYEIDWKERIIAVTESYVVLDKPAGTSVGGTTDNIEESCATFASRALGFSSPLMTTHQIDNCTEGCVVLARTKDYCSVFHKKIRDKKVKKLYLALAAAPMPVGIVTHYMRPVNIAPRLISKDPIEGWGMCQLEVLDCKEVPWPDSVVAESYGIEDCGWPSKTCAYECTVNLLTGRTHQIRAQFAAYGAPILGDSIYMPASLAEIMNPGINPFGKSSKQYSDEDEKSTAIEIWTTQHGKEPNRGIGLQSCHISWDDGEHMFRARTPWWRPSNFS